MLILCGSLATTAWADAGRVYPEGELPKDKRLQPQKDLNGYFPFHPPESLNEWKPRAESLRRRILVSSGLWPMPRKTPANAVVHGRFERKGITIEKVYLESYPGHFISGLLFRPKDKKGPFPAVLSPHGHGGRLQDHGARNRQYIAEGAERFEDCGRFPKISRCVHLARMGCVVFIYDMLGYADSNQISYELAHRFAKQRPELDTPQRWGFFSTQAELRMQSILGIQVYNSIRALDWLASLEDVDGSRLAVTGGSGGGTQTILLGAIDPRPIASFPQGMVSTAMQGGCTCENATCLRIGNGNVELTALFAPRPVAMTGANDWTKEIQTKGYPELRKLFTVYGNVNNVYSKSLLHFGHNYNYVTRNIMYNWFNKHLKLGIKEVIVEEHYEPLTSEEHAVWTKDHPAPKGGVEYEVSLTKFVDDESNHVLNELTPSDPNSLNGYRDVVGGAFETLLNRRLDEVGRIEREKVDKQVRGGYLEFKDKLFIVEHGEELPVLSLFPKSRPWNHEVVIWIDGDGKSGVYADNGALRPEVRALVDGGSSVLTADLLYQGDFLKNGQPLMQTPKVSNSREFAGYTFCYNETVFAHRVHDILSLISFVKNDEHGTEKIHLVGTNGGGALVAAARSQSGDAVHTAVVDTQGFRFGALKTFRDVRFLPGAVKYGDVHGLLSLSAPHALVIAGENGKIADIVAASYKASGKSDQVKSVSGKLGEATKQLVR